MSMFSNTSESDFDRLGPRVAWFLNMNGQVWDYIIPLFLLLSPFLLLLSRQAKPSLRLLGTNMLYHMRTIYHTLFIPLQTIGYPHIIFGFFHHNDHYYMYVFWNDHNIITISPILRSDDLKSPTFLLCIQSPIMFSFNRLASLCRPDRSPNKRPSTPHGRSNMVVVDLRSEWTGLRPGIISHMCPCEAPLLNTPFFGHFFYESLNPGHAARSSGHPCQN